MPVVASFEFEFAGAGAVLVAGASMVPGGVPAPGGRDKVAAFPFHFLAASWASFFLGHWEDLAACGPLQFGHLAITCTHVDPLAATQSLTGHL